MPKMAKLISPLNSARSGFMQHCMNKKSFRIFYSLAHHPPCDWAPWRTEVWGTYQSKDNLILPGTLKINPIKTRRPDHQVAEMKSADILDSISLHMRKRTLELEDDIIRIKTFLEPSQIIVSQGKLS